MKEDGGAPFGTLLRELRLARELSQEELAERCSMSADGIGALERGKRRAPQKATLALLCAGLALDESDRARLVAAAAPQRQHLRRDVDVAARASTERHNLPFPLTSFLGRERQSALLRKLLADHRLVTLTGIGGVGKTRLALEVAHSHVTQFADGAWLVEFAPLADPGLVAARVAATLGVPQRYAPKDAWINEIGKQQLLIVFDNCEHLLEATAAVAQQLLERCPRVRILATSREPLRIPGERVHRLDALELPRTRPEELPSLDDLRRSPAIRMFVDRARDAAPDFDVAVEDRTAWRALQTVCTRLDGMPLAIELAAARLNAISLPMLAQALDRRFDVLTAGARTALPRHQTLRALLDWSYDLLSERERRVLRRLAVFAGGWTLEAAEFVCADNAAGTAPSEVVAMLISLVDKSLVVADTSSSVSRFSMLETTRAYALERLVQSGEYDDAAHVHAEHYLRFLQRANANWGKPSPAEWLRPLELELDNLRAALRWSLMDGHDAAIAAGIAKAQHTILELLSLFGEGVQWSERALTALGPRAEPRLQAPLLVVLAKFYTRAGYAERGFDSATKAVAFYRDLVAEKSAAAQRARAPLAIALGLVARNLAFLGRLEEADRFAGEAVDIARDVADNSAKAWTLYVKSLTVDPRHTAERRALLTEALDYARTLPESYTFGLVLIGFGQAAFDAGDYRKARAHAQEATKHFRESGHDEDLAIAALSLSSVAALAAGDIDLARADARDALLPSPGQLDLSFAVHIVASIAAARGDAAEAARLIGAADALFSEMPTLRVPFLRALYERTLAELSERGSELQIRAWLEQGRKWSFEETVAAALRI